MKPYESLTPIGRSRRMRPIALAALERFGIRPAHLRLLAQGTNSVFLARTQAGRRVVIRVGNPGAIGHGESEIQSEAEWLVALATAEPLLKAPVPIAGVGGELVVAVAGRGVPGRRPCLAYDWIPGRPLSDRLTPDTLEAYGTLIARLHRHGATYRPVQGPTARHDQVFPYAEPVVLFGGDHLHFPDRRRALFVMVAARVEQAIGTLIASGERMRVLHGDLHIWNVLLSRRRLAVIDFEDHLWGWPIQELGTALSYLQDREDFEAVLEAVRRGYERIEAWPEREAGELATFMAARTLVLANDVIHLERSGIMKPAEAARFFERAEARLTPLA